MPSFFTVSNAARSTAVAGASFIHPGKYPTRRPDTLFPAAKSSLLGTHASSCPSGPEIAWSTSIVSTTPRVIAPSLSHVQLRVIAPVRGTRPYVGPTPVTPQRIDGPTILPCVSPPV